MSQQNPVIQPPSLRLKVGGRFGAIDPSAIAKAEAALKSLSGNFAQWLSEEVIKLDAARQLVHDDGVTAETMETLYLRAHDLKGLGATYEFPLITRIGAFAEDNDIVIPSETVSRNHAVIYRKWRHVEIEDKGSTNGTFVNGTKVRASRLEPRDRVRLADVEMVYER